MYKSTDYEHEQLSFINFNMACGMQLDMNNEWVRIAQQLPWRAWETLYVAMFPSTTGNVAKPCRTVMGSLILQMRLGYTDRELVDQLRQNPYYQYFIGLPSFQHTAPFARTLLVEWRKRIDLPFILKANDLLCDAAPKAFRFRKKQGAATRYGTLLATQICDATVAPQYIRYPQDTSLLNEARSKLEKIIDFFCNTYGLEKPGHIAGLLIKSTWHLHGQRNLLLIKSVPLCSRSLDMYAGIWNTLTDSCNRDMLQQQSSATRLLPSICCTNNRSTCMIGRRIRLRTGL